LIGSYQIDMRETDNEALTKARIYVDSINSAPNECGDLFIPIRDGVISLDDISGDLFQLCSGEVAGRAGEDEITLFKSVGHSLEDLVAAKLILTNEKNN
jgi:ornithine cyclodeaminase/alanine dehydrogenase-like protein (mu-crystallin family)